MNMRIAPMAKLCVCVLLVLTSMPVLGAQAPPANETGTAFYNRYQAAFAKATKVEQLTPFMTAASVKEMMADSPARRAEGLEMMKMMAMSNVKVTKEVAAGTGATLTVTGVDPMEKKPQYGTVTLIKEAGAWKISKESWTNLAPK